VGLKEASAKVHSQNELRARKLILGVVHGMSASSEGDAETAENQQAQ
jgi:hypothetical protein